MAVLPAFQIRDGYWYPSGTIFRDTRLGAPSGYTYSDPRTLNASADQWVKRTGGNSPFWELTSTPPLWDVEEWAERLAEAKLQKRRELEASFDDRLTLGMAYDFGQTGIDAKTPVDGQTVLLRRRDQTIIQELTIDASDGVLHLQARAADRSNLAAIKDSLELLSSIIVTPTINFVMAENVAIALDLTLWQLLSLALLQWYGGIFGEFGTYKGQVDALNSIEAVNNFTWNWSQ